MEKMDGKSMDLTKENIEMLKKLFPEVITEGKIDFEKLKIILGENIEKSNERYEFSWNGKTLAMKLSQTPSMGTLRPDKESSKDWDTTGNLYIEGDNLEVLKLLQKSYFGKIKMIYIDPPYNTGKDFVYKDDFRDNIKNYKEITNQTTRANPETSGRYHTDWLNMMYPRLKLARNLLSEDGVIFISIDDNEVANLKKICDEIFGEENFISCFTWRRTDNQPNIGNIAKVKEYISCYSKDKNNLILEKLPLSEKAKNEYRYSDEKGVFRRAILLDKTRGRHFYTIITPSGNVLNGPWMLKENEFKELQKNNGIYWTNGKDEQPYGKIYLKDNKGQIINDFLGIEYGTNQRASIEVEKLFGRRLFDFPKPVSLIKTFITISTKSNDIILDFFSGSATTAHAVMQLNAEDGGNRKFIMVQLPEAVSEDSEAYKAGYKNICEIGKERIRRAGEKIKAETGKEELDIGFKVFKLDDSNIKTWDPDFDKLNESLEDMVNNIKEGRTKEDILFEIILKLGLELNVPIDEIRVKDKVIYNVGCGAVLICLENEITEDILKEIPKHKADFIETRIVFKDSAFRSDSAKLNAVENLKQYGILDVRSV